MKINIKCLCGANFRFIYDEEIDIDQKPEYLSDISNGTFMSAGCPVCGKIHKPEFRIIINWKSKNFKLEVIPELERVSFYNNKKDKQLYETVIGFPEMADRLAVIKDNLEPVVIEVLKSFLLVKAAENYPDKDVNVRYHGKGPLGIEFHLDGIRQDETAVMRIPNELYEKTLIDWQKRPKNEMYISLRVRSYLSVRNAFKPDVLK